MLLRPAVEVQGCDDVHLFAGVRKLRQGRPVAFEGSYGFRGSLVTFGTRKASHRRVDESRSLPWSPYHPEDVAEPLHAGQEVPVDITLAPSATLFRAGEELQLEVRGRWFYARNPLTGPFPAYYEKSPSGRCSVHVGPGVSTYLDIPTLSPDRVPGGTN